MKRLSILIVLIIVVSLIFKFNRRKIISPAAYYSKNTNIADRVIFKNVSDQKKVKQISLQNINDFSKKATDIVNKENAVELLNLSIQNIKILNECIQKNYCGMAKRNDEDPYFDFDRTPAHIYLKRSLEILLESLKIEPSLISSVDWELIDELSKNSNQNIQLLTLDLLSRNGDFNKNIEHLLFLLSQFKGEAKADGLVLLSLKINLENKKQFLNLLEKIFLTDDNDTILNVVSKLGKMSLSQKEIERVTPSICHLKTEILNGANWKMIKHDYFNLNLDLDKICY